LLLKFFAAPSIGAFFIGGESVNSRVGVISIIVEDGNSVETLNSILHTYGEYIIGRMGIPYRERVSASSVSQ
jgi:hypothetical protein